MKHIFEEVGGYQLAWGLFDAMPLVLLLLDEERRVHAVNELAEVFLGREDAEPLRARFGEIIACVHSTEHPDGCGHSISCQTCGVRTANARAMAGDRVERHEVTITRKTPEGPVESAVLLAAAPFEIAGRRLAVLTVEDLAPVHVLRSLLPVCGKCGKVEAAAPAWEAARAWLEANPGAAASSHRCGDCREPVPA